MKLLVILFIVNLLVRMEIFHIKVFQIVLMSVLLLLVGVFSNILCDSGIVIIHKMRLEIALCL